jgi:hypothetical protein
MTGNALLVATTFQFANAAIPGPDGSFDLVGDKHESINCSNLDYRLRDLLLE